MLKYIELISGYSNNGPAFIGVVQYSKSGKTIYFNGKALERGNGETGNHFDLVTGDEYWVSSVKKNGEDRHWSGSGKIEIEEAVVSEYLKITGDLMLNKSRFTVVENFQKTDISKISKIFNKQIN